MIAGWIRLKDIEVKLINIIEIEMAMMVIQEDLEKISIELKLKYKAIDQEFPKLEDKHKLNKEELLTFNLKLRILKINLEMLKKIEINVEIEEINTDQVVLMLIKKLNNVTEGLNLKKILSQDVIKRQKCVEIILMTIIKKLKNVTNILMVQPQQIKRK